MIVQGFLLLGLLVVAPPESATADQGVQPPQSCPITRPASSPFVPPAPYAPDAPFRGRFWYGTEALWAMPSADGLWHRLVTPQGVRNKVFWWSSRWDWRSDMKPALTVTARRLDGDAPSLRVFPATNAHNASDIHHAMLVALDIPTPGCWELTGEYKGQRLSYVVWVPQRAAQQ
jgi:hypothetical protein